MSKQTLVVIRLMQAATVYDKWHDTT